MSYLGAAGFVSEQRVPQVPFAQWDDDDSTSRLRDYPPGFPVVPSLGFFVAWGRWAGGARRYGWKSGFFTALGEGWVTASTWLAPWTDEPLPRALLAVATLTLLVAAIVRADRGRGEDARGP